MKVGVVLENRSPKEGGGYTFETNIFESLIEASRVSDHQFIIFCSKEWESKYSDVKWIKFFPFKRRNFMRNEFI